MYEDLSKLLGTLCLTPAPSGFEGELGRIVKAQLAPFCDSVHMDAVGNVIGVIGGTHPELRPVMINAHMDRVGFIVSSIDSDGFLKLCIIGTPNEKVLPGQTLAVRTGDGRWIPAVVGTKCAHLMTPEDAQRAPRLAECMIDVGVSSPEEVHALNIQVGSPAVFTPTYGQLAGTRVFGTAMDNCGCVAALIVAATQLAAQRPQRTVYLVANVWEEYNQRGTTLPARAYSPVAILNLDMLLAGDTPDVRGHFHGAMGHGPMLSCYNFVSSLFAGCIAHPGLLELAEQAAADLGITSQRYVCVGGLGDNAYAMLENDGSAVLTMGAAVRYAHSSSEIADLSDIHELALLTAALARRIGPDFRQARFSDQ